MTNSERLKQVKADYMTLHGFLLFSSLHEKNRTSSRTSASTNSTELIGKKSSLARSSSLISAGAAPVWNWCCGAPRRTLSPRGWRTLYRNGSASRADRLPPLYRLSAAPHPNPSSPHPVSRLSSRSSAALRSSTLERKTWSYRGKSLSILCVKKSFELLSANEELP